jgi:hypothetical protein
LEPRKEETLLAGVSFDLTTRAASWKEGSSTAVASTEGAVAASFFGFLLSLQRKQKAKTSHKSKEKEASKRENFKSVKTHESKRSKSSSSSLGAEGSQRAALEAEVLEEMISSTRFLFLSRLGSSE